MVTIVWAGNDENKPIKGRNITGGGIMAPLWHQYMEAYYKARPHPAGSFIAPTPTLEEQEENARNTENEQLAGVDQNQPGEEEESTAAPDVQPVQNNPNVTPAPMDPLLGPITPAPAPAPTPTPSIAPGAGQAPVPAPSIGTAPVPRPAPAVTKPKKVPTAAPSLSPHNENLLDF